MAANGERGRGRAEWEFGITRCKLLHLEWIDNKVLLYSTGNYIQSPGINHNRKEYKKNVYICITESLYCTAEISTTRSINSTSIRGFPGGTSAQEPACNAEDTETWARSLGQEDLLEDCMATTPVFLSGESHERGSLAGYSLWGCKQSDMTEATEHTHTHTSIKRREKGGFPGGLVAETLCSQCRGSGFDPWSGD